MIHIRPDRNTNMAQWSYATPEVNGPSITHLPLILVSPVRELR